MTQPERTVEVAIIGGGIAGATLGLGLLRRNISFTIYERASNFREIGAGIAFNPTAVRAMKRLNPLILDGFEKVVTRIDSVEPYVFYMDGFTQPKHTADDDDDDATPIDEEFPVFKRHIGEAGAEGCRRSDFLEEVVRYIPSRNVRFNKNLVWADETRDGRARLTFEDGSSTSADVGEAFVSSILVPKLLAHMETLSYSHWLRWHQVTPPENHVWRGQPSLAPGLLAQVLLPGRHTDGQRPGCSR